MSVQLDHHSQLQQHPLCRVSNASGQDDLAWYTAKSAGSGRWTVGPGEPNNSTGTYFIHVYAAASWWPTPPPRSTVSPDA